MYTAQPSCFTRDGFVAREFARHPGSRNIGCTIFTVCFTGCVRSANWPKQHALYISPSTHRQRVHHASSQPHPTQQSRQSSIYAR